MHRALWGIVVVSLLSSVACALIAEDGGSPPEGLVTRAASPPPEVEVTEVVDDPRTAKPTRAGAASGTEEAQPEPTAHAVRTPDPSLDDWTILIYMSADNDLQQAALLDINEMEAAGQSEGINVLVQVDGVPEETAAEDEAGGARRYEVQADDDLQTIGSPAVESPSATNMGDPGTLSDFIAWGMARYAANRYALVIWGSGAGWRGVAMDGGDGDDLSVGDLGGALQQGLARGERPRLDVLVFDASLMGQLEVLAAIQPYADFAVASEEVMPAGGRGYEALLSSLYAAPSMDGAGLAQHMVEAFGASSEGDTPGVPVTMAAVDLRRLPAVSQAVETLGSALAEAPALTASAAAEARWAATTLAAIYAHGVDYHGAVDLWHLASGLAQRSPVQAVGLAAQDVMTAVEEAVVAQMREPGQQQEAGPSIYFPRRADWYEEAYAAVAPAGWNQFLQAYFEAGQAMAAPPQINVSAADGGTAGLQQPAALTFEVAGRDVQRLSRISARQEADGRLRLLAAEGLDPPAAGAREEGLPGGWPGGVHEDVYVWDTTAAYVTDGANGDFAVLWPMGYEDLYAVRGRYVAEEGSDSVEAVLVFDGETRRLQTVWSIDDDEKRAPRRLSPQDGDGFQLYQTFLDAEQTIGYEPGVTLAFAEGASITYDSFPLPSGTYRAGVLAETLSGGRESGLVQVAVDNEDLVPGYQAYLDLEWGFQFLYPLLWEAPGGDSRRLQTKDPGGQTRLTVSLQPQTAGASAETLKEAALETFGPVDVLYEESISVDGHPGLLTAYGYEGEDGPRTGVLLSFLNRERALGVVADVDGPLAEEQTTLDVADTLADSWQFRPASAEGDPGAWSMRTVEGFDLAAPVTYTHEALDNGWQRFSAGDNFVALRNDAVSGAARAAIVERWLDVAARGVDGFEASDAHQFALAGHIWSRVDFSYGDGAVRGLIVATILDGREIVAWAEAPASVYDEALSDVFLVTVADAVSGHEGESGLLYEESFDAPGAWGTGEMDGAQGRVAGGVYELEVTAASGFFWTTAGQTFGDVSFELAATQRSGPPDNGYGLVLGADTESRSFYVFEISGDGYVWIGRCDDGCNEADTLVGTGWFASDAVNRGLDALNRLRVEAGGPEMVFYVNGVEVGRFSDDAYEAGDVGLFVETLGQGGVTVAFDDVRVTAP